MSAPKLSAKDIILATIQTLIDYDPFLNGYEVEALSDADAKVILNAVVNKGYKLTYSENQRDATVRAVISNTI